MTFQEKKHANFEIPKLLKHEFQVQKVPTEYYEKTIDVVLHNARDNKEAATILKMLGVIDNDGILEF